MSGQAAHKARRDYEYERNGVANLFMKFAPLEGWRHMKVTDHHASIDEPLRERDTRNPQRLSAFTKVAWRLALNNSWNPEITKKPPIAMRKAVCVTVR